jgi:hypothetical protein
MKEINLMTIELHDALLISIEELTIKSHFDIIKLFLKSEHFQEYFNKDTITLIIKECFKVKFNLNLWIQGYDSIQQYTLSENTEWIQTEKSNFKNGFGPKDLKQFCIELNSGSVLDFLITKPVYVE